MSVISLPRRLDGPTRVPGEALDVQRRAARRAHRRRTTPLQRAVIVLGAALALSLGGSMLVANRQVEIHALQTHLLQVQSTYAVNVGTLTNSADPAAIAREASSLHLVDPVNVIQVPATSLAAPLPLPTFVGSAPVTPRTQR